MERFDLSEAQVTERLAAQAQAIELYEPIQEELDEDYAGAWFDNDVLSLVVATTNPLHADMLRSLEVEPVVVARSLSTLQREAQFLQEAVKRTPDLWNSMTGWAISYQDNTLRIDVLPDAVVHLAAHLQTRTLMDLSAVTFQATPGRAEPLNSIRAGDEHLPIDSQGMPCSFGFAVERTLSPGNYRYLTAGHCGWPQHQVQNNATQILGTYTMSTYPPEPMPNQNPAPVNRCLPSPTAISR